MGGTPVGEAARGRRTRLRSVDLARTVGISTQQVRNYEDWGVLPPVPRSEFGYRHFDERHRLAMLAYRGLAAGHGPQVAKDAMRAVQADDLPAALAMIDASHAALHRQREELASLRAALEKLTEELPEEAPVPREGLRIREVAHLVGVRPSALRVWESAGLLAPGRERVTGYRRYDATDVRDARVVAMLRRGHHPLPGIRPLLEELRRTGSSAALLEAMARQREILTWRARAMLDGAARLHAYLTAEGVALASPGQAAVGEETDEEMGTP